MKVRLSFIAITILLIAFVISCAPRKAVPESLTDIKEVLATLDSDVNDFYDLEQEDSTYNASVDSMVYNVTEQYKADHPEDSWEITDNSIRQETFDKARATWAEFKRLCDEDKYEEALDFYFEEGPDSQKKNAGSFLICLKTSTQRFVFYSRVLFPIMLEYRGKVFANKEYIEVLELEKVVEEFITEMAAETTGYIPEVYPHVLEELGVTYVYSGRFNEALKLIENYIIAIYGLTGDTLLANYRGTDFAARLYLLDKNPQEAIETWNSLKSYLEEYKSDYDPDELTRCFEKINEEIKDIRIN